MNFHGIQHYDHDRFPHFDVIAYHDHCTDGSWRPPSPAPSMFGRTTSPSLFLSNTARIYRRRSPKAGQDPVRNFCPERKQLSQIAGAWADYFVIDHHKSRDWTAEDPGLTMSSIRPSIQGAFPHLVLVYRQRGAPDCPICPGSRSLAVEAPRSREVSAALGEEPKTVDRFLELLFSNPHDLLPQERSS